MKLRAGRYGSFLVATALLALGLAPPSEFVAALEDAGPNRHDIERIERGYYEQLLDSGRKLSVVEPVPFDAGRLCDVVADLREYVLKPNLRTEHRGASWTTNSRGMRDGEYASEKPANTIRVALVGDSIGSGWGVDDGQGFEPTLERAWNERRSGAIEVLNFSVPGHAPGQRWEQFRRAGWPTSPDVVIFEATPADPGWDERRLRGLLARRIGWDAPQYRDAIAASGVRRGGDFETYKSILKPHRWAILDNVYRQAVAECRERGVVPVWVLIPRVGKPIAPADRARLIASANSAGFAVVADVSDGFDGLDPTELAIAPNDFHPNARGHRILANRIDAALSADPTWRALMEGRR